MIATSLEKITKAPALAMLDFQKKSQLDCDKVGVRMILS